MKNILGIFVLLLAAACNTAQTNFVLSATDFKSILDQTSGAQLVDVRTSEEFSGGHIANALNFY